MKQNLLYLLLAVTALCSCDEEDVRSERIAEKTVPIQFSVSTACFYNPVYSGTRSGNVVDLNTPTSNEVLSNGLLLTCYDVTVDSVVFSNYIYSVKNEVGTFTDSVGNSVDTPMWPGKDEVEFYAYYYNGSGGQYYILSDWGLFDYTIQKNQTGHWCVGLNNRSNLGEGADLLACKVRTSRTENQEVQLNLQHILTMFSVTAQRSAATDSIHVTDFTVTFPDSVVYDFTDAAVKRVEGVTAQNTIQAIPRVDESSIGDYYFNAYTSETDGSGLTTIVYLQSVNLTEAFTDTNYYWYLAVPDSLKFQFGYQLIDGNDSIAKSASTVVKPSAGQKISYLVSLPGKAASN